MTILGFHSGNRRNLFPPHLHPGIIPGIVAHGVIPCALFPHLHSPGAFPSALTSLETEGAPHWSSPIRMLVCVKYNGVVSNEGGSFSSSANSWTIPRICIAVRETPRAQVEYSIECLGVCDFRLFGSSNRRNTYLEHHHRDQDGTEAEVVYLHLKFLFL